MATDKSIVDGLFAGDSTAFTKFFGEENRALFERFFLKHFPKSSLSIPDIYQESCMELWRQISEGRLARSSLNVDIFTYLTSIGRNKYFEQVRENVKISRLKKGERVFRRRRSNSDEPDEEEDNRTTFVLQGKKQQKELFF